MSVLDVFRPLLRGALGCAACRDEALPRERRHVQELFDLQMVQGHIADKRYRCGRFAGLRAAWAKDSGAARMPKPL